MGTSQLIQLKFFNKSLLLDTEELNMLSVLPNFLRSTLLVLATALSFNAFAGDYGEKAVEEAADVAPIEETAVGEAAEEAEAASVEAEEAIDAVELEEAIESAEEATAIVTE